MNYFSLYTNKYNSVGLSSSSSFISAHTSSPSGISSTSNKNRNNILNGTQYHQRDDPIKPSNSSTSVTSNIGTALSVLANNTNTNSYKQFISNSISLHGDVSALLNAQANDLHLSSSAINDIDGKGNKNVIYIFNFRIIFFLT